MSQATKGPWRIGLTTKKGDVWRGWRETDINGPEGCFLTLSQYHEADEADANARLIAAAPEMVDDVIRPLAEYTDLLAQHYPDLIGLVRAAKSARALLARIEGE